MSITGLSWQHEIYISALVIVTAVLSIAEYLDGNKKLKWTRSFLLMASVFGLGFLSNYISMSMKEIDSTQIAQSIIQLINISDKNLNLIAFCVFVSKLCTLLFFSLLPLMVTTLGHHKSRGVWREIVRVLGKKVALVSIAAFLFEMAIE